MSSLQVSYKDRELIWWTDDFHEPHQHLQRLGLSDEVEVKKMTLNIRGKKKRISCVSISLDQGLPILWTIDQRQWDVGAGPKAMAHTARWALGLLARGRWLPAVTRQKNWKNRLGLYYRPVFDAPDDRARLQTLSRMLPGAVRAAQPDWSESELIESFVSDVVDHLLRTDFQEEPNEFPASRLKKVPYDLDDWIEAVARGDTEMKMTEAPEFQALLETWARDLDPIVSQARLLFRLCLPESSSGWLLNVFLQATDDLSLQIPLAQAWAEPESLPAAFQEEAFSVRERLLRDMGRASRRWPVCGRALSGSVPAPINLGEEEVEEFLQSAAWMLEEIGMAVQLPSALARPSKVDVNVAVRSKSDSDSASSTGLLSESRLVEFDWNLALGGERLTEQELQSLAASRSSLLEFRGQWIHLDKEHLQKALQLWKEGRSDQGDLLNVLNGTLAEELSEIEAKVEFTGDLAALQDEHSLTVVEQPDTLQAKLRHYQERGYSWMTFLRQRGLGACLADDMGLGKTIQTIALLLLEQKSGRKGTHLLICPTSILGNWERELDKFGPSLKVHVHHGSSRVSAAELKKMLKEYDLILSTYGIVQRESDAMKKFKWLGLLLDEAHTIKNSQSRQSKAVRSLKSEFRIALTGTPIENRLTELWTLMDFLNPGLLGKRAGFVKRFSIPIERYGNDVARRQLRQVVEPFILRRLKSDPDIAPDLPDKEEIKEYCSLTPEQAALYQAHVNEMLKVIEGADGIGRKGLVLKSLMRLKQVCNHPSLILDDDSPLAQRSGKLTRLEEMLEQLVEVGESALVFTQFAQFAQRLAPYLEERLRCRALCLHGGVPRKKRDAMVEQFQTSTAPQIFVISIKAGGVGLNLTRATRVFHFDRWWNPAVENQATDRAYRIGQTQKVQVYKFLCPGTLEERIDELIEQKTALSESVVGTGESWLTELDNRRLREIVSLGGSNE
jgi:SNF2-related domain/SNF2 Helicase protein/Helicase conserved C-terminal domain